MEKDHLITVDGTPFFRKIDGVGRYSVSFVHDLAKEMPSRQFLILGFWDDKKKENLLENNLPKNVAFFYFPLPRKVYQFIFSRLIVLPLDFLLPRTMKVTWHISTNFTCFPYLSRARRMICVHDLAFKDIPETLEKKNLRYLQRRVGWSLQKSHKIVTISQFSKKRLIQNFSFLEPGAILVHPPKIDVANFSITKPTVQKRYGLPKTYLLTLGTLEPRKNLYAVMLAFAQLPLHIRKKYPLVIAGSRGWGSKHDLPDERYIIFTGYVADSDLSTLYTHAKLFIFPSLYEGFGIPVAEAMFHESPVLSSPLDPVVEFAGDSIFYTTTSDTREFARNIQKNINKTNDTKKAKDKITKFYASNKSIKSLVEILT